MMDDDVEAFGHAMVWVVSVGIAFWLAVALVAGWLA